MFLLLVISSNKYSKHSHASSTDSEIIIVGSLDSLIVTRPFFFPLQYG